MMFFFGFVAAVFLGLVFFIVFAEGFRNGKRNVKVVKKTERKKNVKTDNS